MILVDRAVHSDRGTQLLRQLVIPDLPQHGAESGGAQVGGARGYDLTHPLSGYAVLQRRVQVEAAENLLCAQQTFSIPAGEAEYQ